MVDSIVEAEKQGIPAVWMTSGGDPGAGRTKLDYFPTTAFYSKMFEEPGFSNALQSGWTDEIIDSIVITDSARMKLHIM